MQDQDFYRPPQADLTAAPAVSSVGGITPRMIELLGKTRPWVLLMAIMGFIGTGLMVIVGIVMAMMTALGADDAQLAGMGGILGVVYLFIAVIYFFPCWFLMKYAGAIRNLVDGGGAGAMEEALDRQYSFWRLVGTIMAVVMAIYALILVIGVIMAVMSVA